MKLQVNGIVEIEITDPNGLCNPPATQAPPPAGQPMVPQTAGVPMQPYAPDTGRPWGVFPRPTTGDIIPPKPGFYTRHLDDPAADRVKWGVGGPMITEAGQQVDPDKWQKNWQAKMTGEEDQDNGNRSYR